MNSTHPNYTLEKKKITVFSPELSLMQDQPHAFPIDVQNIYEFISARPKIPQKHHLRPQLTDLRCVAMAVHQNP